MIICISANPAIDRRVRVKNLKIGAVNRVKDVKAFAGGKAAHVALAARALGEKIIWIGFLGGANGFEIERQLTAFGIEVIAVHTKSQTRTNDEIIDENGQITEILQPGGSISNEEIEDLFDICRKVFAKYSADFTAVLSGSLPQNVSSDFYAKLILLAQAQNGKTILDTSGEAFANGLIAKPDLVKPNIEEAENMVKFKIQNRDDSLLAAKSLLDNGIEHSVISLGADGLIWASAEKSPIFVKPPKVRVNSTVGCGDATVAGFAVALERKLSVPQLLRLAVACGAANCLADLPGQIRGEDVEKLLPSVEISVIADGLEQ